MVRIKHRYLLIEILYPSTSTSKTQAPSTTTTTPLPDTVLFHAPSPGHLTPGLLARMIREKLGELYGDYGVGMAGNGLAVKYLSLATSVAILRCSRDAYRLVWSAITYIREIPGYKGRDAVGNGEGKECVMRVVRVSGTIRKAEEEAILRARRAVLAVREKDKDGGEVGSGDLLGNLLGGGVDGGGSGEGGGIEDSDEGDDEEDEAEESEEGLWESDEED